ncbi:MAG: phosphoadenosine phosphosulfate reductase, partial [Cyanobacteriota bacterium]|nr:phosphoadenosine phosphosulfate reductase [Cyanobacteriota bacterium]
GYTSVGDWHSSAPDDGQGRSSRFGGRRQECGIHLPSPLVEGAGI